MSETDAKKMDGDIPMKKTRRVLIMKILRRAVDLGKSLKVKEVSTVVKSKFNEPVDIFEILEEFGFESNTHESLDYIDSLLNEVEETLFKKDVPTYSMTGDNHGIWATPQQNCSFSFGSAPPGFQVPIKNANDKRVHSDVENDNEQDSPKKKTRMSDEQ